MSHFSLRNRFRNGALVLVFTVVTVGVLSIPGVYRLGNSIRQALYRNYRSIEAAQRMHEALRVLELAECCGGTKQYLVRSRAIFFQSIDLAKQNITEPGEDEVVADIDRRSQALFAELASAPPSARHREDFEQLHARIDELTEINKSAMFRVNSRAFRLANRLEYELGAVMVVLLIVATVISLGLGWALLKPLNDLTAALHSISQRKSPRHLGAQKFIELDAVAREFNHMADKLEEYEKLSIERLLYEKSKTEAIIEGLGDGIILLNPDRVVSHINQAASVILGVERDEALGSPFDDLSCNSPHYEKVLEAANALRKRDLEHQQIEVHLQFRSKDRSYVLRRVPLNQNSKPLGVLLVLQDVTFLREHDLTHAKLISALSIDLQEPLNSLESSLGNLRIDEAAANRELMEKIRQECEHLRHLTENLLNLARSEAESKG